MTCFDPALNNLKSKDHWATLAILLKNRSSDWDRTRMLSDCSGMLNVTVPIVRLFIEWGEGSLQETSPNCHAEPRGLDSTFSQCALWTQLESNNCVLSMNSKCSKKSQYSMTKTPYVCQRKCPFISKRLRTVRRTSSPKVCPKGLRASIHPPSQSLLPSLQRPVHSLSPHGFLILTNFFPRNSTAFNTAYAWPVHKHQNLSVQCSVR